MKQLPTLELPGPDKDASMRQMLKQHTAVLHHKLDNLPALSSLLKAELSLPDYHRTLNGYALAFETLEDDLLRAEMTLCLGRVPRYTPRLPSLVRDLDVVGQWTSASRRFLAPSREHRRIYTESQYWGARYVFEGATQGSKFIALQLRKHLPQLEPRAFEFWKLQLRLAQDWVVICERLAQRAPKGDSRKQMLGGADIAFNTFFRFFAASQRHGEIGA